VARRQAQFPWVLATIGVALVVVGGVALLRFPTAPDPKRVSTEAPQVSPMQLSRTGNGVTNTRLQEELALQDPTPLFGPTRWNSGQAPQPVMPEPGTAFVSFTPALIFPDADLPISIPATAAVPADAQAAVNMLEREPKLMDFSRRDLTLPPLPQRVAQIEVRQMGSGELRLSQTVGEPRETEQLPALRQEFWTPVHLMIAINPAGLVGRPVMVASSGSERIDNWALDFLANRAHLAARLGPGFYRVVVGP
jgi:hypothetical protein